MAKQNSVAPKERVNITYRAATGEGSKEVELPNKMMVVGDFTMREEEDEVEDREKINVNKGNFNDVMANHKLSLNFIVDNKLSNDDNEELGVDLVIENIASFSPENVARQVPELAKLLELREALTFLKGPLGNIPAFRKQVDSLLQDNDAREKLLQELAIEKQ